MAAKSSSYDKRIAFLRYGLVRDDHGDDAPGFEPLKTVWASVRPAPGAERLQNAEVAATAPMVFRTPWRPDLDPNAPGGLNAKDQVQYPPETGRIFEIVSAVEIGRREGIEVAAKARAD